MTATTPATFDPKPLHLGLMMTFTTGADVLAGQVLAFAGTGVSRTVIPTDTDTPTDGPIGVAMADVTSGGLVNVAMVGSVIKVCEGAGSAIDAGSWVVPHAAAGCVATLDPAIGAHAGEATQWYVGQALDDISGNSTGYIVVIPGPMETASS